MIRIDSDTHFTPMDAFADLDPKYTEQGPRVVALPTGHLSDRLSRARAARAGAHQTTAGRRPAEIRLRSRATPGSHGARRLRHTGFDSQQLALLLRCRCRVGRQRQPRV